MVKKYSFPESAVPVKSGYKIMRIDSKEENVREEIHNKRGDF